MTIELTIIISFISVSFALYFGLKNNKRNETKDIKKDVAEATTVIVKLDNISLGITEIKAEMQNIKQVQREDHDKLIEVIVSARQAHKRIDDFVNKGMVETNGV